MEKSLHIAHFSFFLVWTLCEMSVDKDREASRAAVLGVSKIWTGLSDWTTNGQWQHSLYSLWNLHSCVRFCSPGQSVWFMWNFYRISHWCLKLKKKKRFSISLAKYYVRYFQKSTLLGLIHLILTAIPWERCYHYLCFQNEEMQYREVY